jgi:hypothetical protein
MIGPELGEPDESRIEGILAHIVGGAAVVLICRCNQHPQVGQDLRDPFRGKAHKSEDRYGRFHASTSMI